MLCCGAAQVPSSEAVAERQRAAAIQLRGVRAQGRSLCDLVDSFRHLLGRKNLCSSRMWLARARLWRFILCAARSTLLLTHHCGAGRTPLRPSSPQRLFFHSSCSIFDDLDCFDVS